MALESFADGYHYPDIATTAAHQPPPFQLLHRPGQPHAHFTLGASASAQSTSSGSVKSERSSSPHLDLSPSPLHNFSFHYPPPSSATINNPSEAAPSTTAAHDPPIFRFGMAHSHSGHASDAWSLKRPQAGASHGSSIALDLNALSFPDEYDDGDELGDLPGPSGSGSGAQGGQSERVIRRRSSKGTLYHSDE
ncbi:hypothetical protein HYDPIDRAFT_170581 [Hydnomerulius pinastri MD-312]|uniref:Unplaced genomic scaffold scaffold_45, whole genome shotgun sequence n=1 Tax=Hydnomerulius pinastri MD-312 TaxID=994086 RepID=A0A0C9W9F2_9AGAM|nr:hypothetical protein HYDPIDRAFT_170581 [Hydnomerulius pinastri MD-312]